MTDHVFALGTSTTTSITLDAAEDVLAAIDECDFPELVDDVRGTLSAFQSAKRKKKASAGASSADAEASREDLDEKPSSDVEGEDLGA